MRYRLSRALTERPVEVGAETYYLNRELVPVVREVLRALTVGPTEFSWASGAASLDLSAGRDFAAANTLTQNSVLTLSNGYDGAEGVLFVKQDGVGGHTVTAVAVGRTILREDPFVDDNPAPGANEVTQYRYTFVTIAGTPYVVLERLYLT